MNAVAEIEALETTRKALLAQLRAVRRNLKALRAAAAGDAPARAQLAFADAAPVLVSSDAALIVATANTLHVFLHRAAGETVWRVHAPPSEGTTPEQHWAWLRDCVIDVSALAGAEGRWYQRGALHRAHVKAPPAPARAKADARARRGLAAGAAAAPGTEPEAKKRATRRGSSAPATGRAR
jgi:hypothetical protein